MLTGILQRPMRKLEQVSALKLDISMQRDTNCVKGVQILSFSYSVFFPAKSEYGKILTRKACILTLFALGYLLLCLSMNWFLYDRDLRHERAKHLQWNFLTKSQKQWCLTDSCQCLCYENIILHTISVFMYRLGPQTRWTEMEKFFRGIWNISCKNFSICPCSKYCGMP